MTEISLKEMVLAEQDLTAAEEYEQHVHQEGRVGASNIGSCILLRAWKNAKLPMPEVTGLKADKSVFPLGHLIHGYVADKAKAYAVRNGLYCMDEVFVESQLTPYTIVESPIDVAFASENVFYEDAVQFRNQMIVMNHCADPTKITKIFDVKSCSEYTYWKVLKEGPSFHWQAQMHIYMQATGLKEVTILLYYKPKGWMSEIVVKWDIEIWQKIKHMQERVEELTDTLIYNKQHDLVSEIQNDIKEADLEYLTEGEPICWYSCPFSQTREEIAESGKPSLILEKPCEWACIHLRKKAQEKFAVGQKWKRGLSHITITEIGFEQIKSINKSGKTYEDSIYYALKEFSVL